MKSQRGSALWIILGLIVVVTAVGLYLLRFAEPPPPKRVTLVTGSETGAYYAYGKQYAQQLKKSGIDVDVVTSRGSIENIARIKQGEGLVVGFVQGGLVDRVADAELRALGSLYYEPLWVFYQSHRIGDDIEELEDLHVLKGRRVAVGPAGSGTRSVAMELLRENGIVNAVGEILPPDGGPPTTLLSIPSTEARRRLGGEGVPDAERVDAAFFIAGARSKAVIDLLSTEGIRLMDFERHLSYRHRLKYVSAITVHEGMVDLGRNVPKQNTTLLAPAALLVAHEKTHPGLVELFVTAALDIHREPDIGTVPGEFPSTEHCGDLRLDETAQRIIEDGPSILSRYLPFAMVSMIRRLKIFIIGLIPVLIILSKLGPALYRWSIMRRILPWYAVLNDLELSLAAASTPAQLQEVQSSLADTAVSVAAITVPTGYMPHLHNLRLHVNRVRQRAARSPET